MKETRVHKEPIRKIFLVPVDVEHDEIEVDYLRLTSRKAKFQNERFGMVYEKIGKENRRAIYIRTPLVLTYDISIPVNQPILKFGLGILDETQPIQFIIRINLNGIEKELYALSVSDSNRWQDARIDMSAYAGKQVELSVSVDGGRNAIGFWSDPILYSPPAKKLNIILVMEDALRADHMSCYGYNRKTTPVKDVWAQKGVLFLNAYSQATYTKPSCASLMTSLYPSATGVLNYFDILHENYLTMAEILRNKGFATGSFTQNIFTGPAGGMHQGFGSVFDWETIGIYANTIYKGPDLMEWIAQNSDRNFFLFLHIIDPHSPYSPPEDVLKGNKKPYLGGKYKVKKSFRYDPEWIEKPTVGSRNFLYDQEVKFNDFFFEHFLKKLDQMRLLNDTLIIFLADHGERLGEHGLWDHGPPGFRHVLHVPLIMVYPGKLPANLRVPQPVQLIDVLPTVLDIAGINTDQFLLQGDSLLTLIRNQRLEFWNQRFSYSEEVRYKQRRISNSYGSAFGPKWQIMNSKNHIDTWAKRVGTLNKSAKEPFSTIRVYDMLTDPYGSGTYWPVIFDPFFNLKIQSFMNKLYAANQSIWSQVTKEKDQTMKLDAGSIERLRSLGYVK